MNKSKRYVLVLDDKKYIKEYENIKQKFLSKGITVDCYITKYENKFIRKFRSIKKVGSLIQHISYWLLSLKYAIIIIIKYDYIITINPIVGFFLGLMRRKSKKIILCGFLFEEKKNKFYYNVRKKITTFSLKGVDKVIVYASNEVNYYSTIFSNLKKFIFIEYGLNFEKEESYGKILPTMYLFSGGGSNRDYQTLISAYDIVKDKAAIPLVIATNPRLLDMIDCTNVDVLNDVTLETFGDVLIKSSLLILSLRDAKISAGHMVLLQALKYGIPILVNDIKAIRDYVTDKDVTFYESENTIDLSCKILECMEINGKKLDNKNIYYEKYTFDKFLDRLLDKLELER